LLKDEHFYEYKLWYKLLKTATR